jgi:cytochrome c biogenesis protein CcdA
MMRKLFSFLLFFSLFFPMTTIFAQSPSDTVDIFVFSRADCRHCQDEKIFLTELQETYNFARVHYLDIHTEPYTTRWRELSRLEGYPLATPLTVVGGAVISGFDTAETTGSVIETLLLDSQNTPQPNPQEIIEQGGSKKNVLGSSAPICTEDGSGICTLEPTQTTLSVSVPLIGSVDVGAYPLTALSLVLGFVDGFNPCAMWVLVTFLLILAQSRSKKEMLIFSGIFLAAQAIIYWLILTLWFTAWDFVALDSIITPIIGIVAVGGGVFFLWEWKNADGTCQITNPSKREKIMRKIRTIVTKPLNPASILAVLTLAFGVTIIEFACSIGIPQAFTKILEMNNLTVVAQQGYTLLYLLAYMIDDLFVVILAIWSIHKIHLTTHYSKWTNLIGGILMLLLGLLLIFSPDTLRFV